MTFKASVLSQPAYELRTGRRARHCLAFQHQGYPAGLLLPRTSEQGGGRELVASPTVEVGLAFALSAEHLGVLQACACKVTGAPDSTWADGK